MNIRGHFTLLGTGASMGVPVIGCTCPVCLSQSTYNKRLRSSALCCFGKKCILIDCGPDFRIQALTHHIDHLDGVILTHAHSDHSAGIDDLRAIYFRSEKTLPLLLSAETLADIKRRFYYLFPDEDPNGKGLSRFDIHVLESDRGKCHFQGITLTHFAYGQGGMRVDGFRLGDLAYVSDIRHYPETIFEDLDGVKTLIISALRFPSSHMHFSVDEAIDFAGRVGARQTWLTHISHELDYDKTNAYLPDNIRMAYDGLKLEFQTDNANTQFL